MRQVQRMLRQAPSAKSCSPQFGAACRKALRRVRGLDAVGRDRIIADLRLQFDHAGEYVAYIDRYKTLDRSRRLSREVLAHSSSIDGVQLAITNAPLRDQSRIVVRYVDAVDAGPQLLHELPGRD